MLYLDTRALRAQIGLNGPDQPHLGSPLIPVACPQLCLFTMEVPDGWGYPFGFLCSVLEVVRVCLAGELLLLLVL